MRFGNCPDPFTRSHTAPFPEDAEADAVTLNGMMSPLDATSSCDDAGLGAPSQAAEAMEMGADAVLVNTAIAIASDPNRMARAFKLAVEAGREAREIGLADKLNAASATSPVTGFLEK